MGLERPGRGAWGAAVQHAKGVLYTSTLKDGFLGPGYGVKTRAEAERAAPELFNWSEPEPELVAAERTWGFPEVTDDDLTGAKSLRRYRGVDSGVRAASPALCLGANLLVYAIKQGERSESRLELLRLHGWFVALQATNYAEWASWMNGKAKKLNVRLGRDWWVLAELATIGGYAEVDESSFLEEVTAWVTQKRALLSPFVGVSWLDAFRSGLYVLMDQAWQRKDLDVQGLREWASDPMNWGLQGSGFDLAGKRTYVKTFRGPRVRTEKNKWALALGLTPDEVVHRILRHTRQEAKAVPKQETKKVRPVAAADVDTYLKMSYPDHVVRQLFAGSPLSTLWCTSLQRSEIMRRLAAGGVAAALDQANFDRSIQLVMVLAMVEVLAELLWEATGSEDVWAAMVEVHFALSGGFVNIGPHRVPIRNGVLSGWLWTALFDTLANLAELVIAEAVLKRRYRKPILNRVGQGDDLDVCLSEWGALVDLMHVYAAMKLPVSTSKTIVSSRIREFLRKFGDLAENRVQGYPARSISGILWRNPINDTERPGQQRLSGIFERWNALGGRLGMHTPPAALVDDLCRGNELTPTAARLWLATPNALGGAGILTDPQHLYLETTTATRTFFGLFPSRSELPGLEAIVHRAHEAGLEVREAALDNWANSLLRYGPKALERHSDWDSATFEVRQWRTTFVTRSARAPPVRSVAPDVAELLQIFPSDANVEATGNPRPAGASLRWWVAYITNTLKMPVARVWGASPEWSSVSSEEWGRGLVGGFWNSGSHSWARWRVVLATAEMQARVALVDWPRFGPFMSP
jgi:hypothetical protein